MKKLLLALSVALSLGGAFAACGGDVVVDGAATGTGATTGSTSTITSSTTLASGSCFNAPPAGSLTLCGGSSGTPSSCSFAYCEGSAQTYTANCTGNTCQCLHGVNVICTCALTSAGNFCTGTPDCCFTGSL